MIDHLSIGCSNIVRAKNFYKKILELFDFKIIHEDNESIGFEPTSGPELWIAPPLNESQSFSPSNSFHLCFKADSEEKVKIFYNLSLELGATSEDEPDIREQYGPNYYAAYVIDPEGNKIEAAFY